MDRRNFIKLTAVTGTGAALTACGNPEHQLIRFVPDDDIVPGIAEWKPGVCPLCAAGCGLNVRVMDADFETTRNGQPGVVAIKAAKKLEGQAAHPVNRGGLCARGQAAIQVTYHPDRLIAPMKRNGPRGSGAFAPVSWDEAIAELVGQLDGLQPRSALACVVRRRPSRRNELIAEFLARFGAPPPIVFEFFHDDVLRRANAISFGREQLPTFDIAHADFVLSFGADFLGTWNAPTANAAAYGDMRQGQPGSRGKFVQVEPRMSLTGASADEWIPVKPGTEGALALGLAHVLVASNLATGDRALFSDYTPEAVEKMTGVPARRVERLGRELGERRPAVAIVGGPPLAYTNALFHALSVNALNRVLGSVDAAGGMSFMPQLPAIRPGGPSVRPSSDIQSLHARVLLVDDGANPVFGSPKAWRVSETIAQIPFVASFSSFLDDTTALADLILPDHTFLESWTDSLPESGASVAVAGAAGPVMRPLYQTRATPDLLLEVAGKLKTPVALPWKSFDEMLKAGFDALGKEAWEEAGKTGFAQSQVAGRKSQVDSRSSSPNLRFTAPSFDGDANAYPFHFLPYASQAFYDGSTAHLPWLQELPDPMTSAMWSSWVEINPNTAGKLGIAYGDIVEVASTQGAVRVPAVISPGIAPDMVAMPVGQGHETFTRYASKRGVNPIGIVAAMKDSETGALAWAATRVRIARVAPADGSLISFAGEMRENPNERGIR
jgi:anaerobic selenocysteine-containing dehydrogenase